LNASWLQLPSDIPGQEFATSVKIGVKAAENAYFDRMSIENADVNT
jgi:hypothetical protein